MRACAQIRNGMVAAAAAAMLTALVAGCGDEPCTVNASYTPPVPPATVGTVGGVPGGCRGQRCNIVINKPYEVKNFAECQALAESLDCPLVNLTFVPKTGGCKMENCGVCDPTPAGGPTPTPTP